METAQIGNETCTIMSKSDLMSWCEKNFKKSSCPTRPMMSRRARVLADIIGAENPRPIEWTIKTGVILVVADDEGEKFGMMFSSCTPEGLMSGVWGALPC